VLRNHRIANACFWLAPSRLSSFLVTACFCFILVASGPHPLRLPLESADHAI
jgi:hypothetical protein